MDDFNNPQSSLDAAPQSAAPQNANTPNANPSGTNPQTTPAQQIYPQQSPTPPPTPVYHPIPSAAKPVFTKHDSIFAVLMIFIGFFFVEFIFAGGMGISVAVFTLLFAAVALAWFAVKKVSLQPTSFVYLGAILLLASLFGLFENALIKTIAMLFLVLLSAYWIAVCFGIRYENKIGAFFAADVTRSVIATPFSSFGHAPSAAFKSNGKSRGGKNILLIIAALVVFLPITMLVLSLLNSADEVFQNMLRSITRFLTENILTYVFKFIVGIPIGFYLFGMIYGNFKKRGNSGLDLESAKKNAQLCRFIPGVMTYTLIIQLSVLYLIFAIAQGAYFFSSFANLLPEGLTYAQSARRGFFELCAVCAINLAVIGFAHLLTKRQEGSRKLGIFTFILSLFSMFLIVSALSKMILYMRTYGLTQMRIYTSWFMIGIFIAFTVIILRMFLPKVNVTKCIVTTAIAMFLMLGFANPSALVMRYNIAMYNMGFHKNLDAAVAYNLDEAAVPFLYDLYKGDYSQEIKNEARDVLVSKINRRTAWHNTDTEGKTTAVLEERNWKSFNITYSNAMEIYGLLLAEDGIKAIIDRQNNYGYYSYDSNPRPYYDDYYGDEYPYEDYYGDDFYPYDDNYDDGYYDSDEYYAS